MRDFLKNILKYVYYYFSPISDWIQKQYNRFDKFNPATRANYQKHLLSLGELHYTLSLQNKLSQIIFYIFLRLRSFIVQIWKVRVKNFFQKIIDLKKKYSVDQNTYPSILYLKLKIVQILGRKSSIWVQTPKLLIWFLQRKKIRTDSWFLFQCMILFDVFLTYFFDSIQAEIKEHKEVRSKRFKMVKTFINQKRSDEPEWAPIFIFIIFVVIIYIPFSNCKHSYLIQFTINWSLPSSALYIYILKFLIAFTVILFSRSLAPRYHIEKLIEVFWKKKILIFTTLFILVFIILLLIL